MAHGLKSLYSFVMPGGLVLLAGLVLLRPRGLPDWSLSLVFAYAYIFLGAGILLGWYVGRSRVLFSTLLLALADRALTQFWAGEAATEAVGRLVFNSVALLLPLNFMAVSFIRESPMVSRREIMRLGLILLQAGLVAWVGLFGQPDLAAPLESPIVDPRYTRWTPIAQPALLAFGAAFVHQTARSIRLRNPLERGFVWALLAVFVALLLPSGLVALSWRARLARAARQARAFARFLADELTVDYFETLTRLRKTEGDGSLYQIIARRVPATKARTVLEKAADEGFKGLSTERDPIRAYPLDDVAANIIGFIGQDDETGPLAGLERTFDKQLAGRDGLRFAELLTPRDLSKCRVGEGRYVLLTDDSGGIVNDPVLLRIEESRFWLACADSDVLLWAKGVARSSGMQVELRELDVAPLQIQGPRSRDLVSALFGSQFEGLKYYEFKKTAVDDIPVIVTRTGWTGELGYELYLLDPARGVELWNRVIEAGRRYNIAPTGPSDIRRIEAGILNYGIDMTLDNNPYELGLERLVNLDKAADFIGKEALVKQKADGLTRKLCCLTLSDNRVVALGKEPIREERGKIVGWVSSGGYGYSVGQSIIYAYLPVECAKEGTHLEIEFFGEQVAATVVQSPLWDPKGERIRA